MSEEKTQVLRLLEQGRISYEEALALLQALGGPTVAQQEEPKSEPATDFGPDLRDDLVADDDDADDDDEGDEDCEQPDCSEYGRELQGLGEEISREVREALQEAGREVNSALTEVGEELRNLGRDIDIPSFFQGLFSGNLGNRYTWHETREIAIDSAIKAIALDIATKNGSVRLLPTDGEQVVARLQMRIQAASEAEAREQVEQYLYEQQEVQGDQLQLTWHVEDQLAGAISFEILIPHQLLIDLNLSSKNGSVTVEDLQAAGKIMTKNGSVKVNGITYGDLGIETKNGSITAQAGVGTFTASSKNGSVRCALEPLRDGNIKLDASNGSVQAELACEDGIGYELELQTRNGRVNADLPDLVVATREKHYLRGTTPNWQEARVKTQVFMASRNGSVSVRPR